MIYVIICNKNANKLKALLQILKICIIEGYWKKLLKNIEN